MKEKKELALRTYGFSRTNLMILLFSMCLIIIGYVFLSGGRSDDGISFNPEVFNTMRTSVAPIILTIGYVGVLVAIIWKSKSSINRGSQDKE